jgi:hypothetical protein
MSSNGGVSSLTNITFIVNYGMNVLCAFFCCFCVFKNIVCLANQGGALAATNNAYTRINDCVCTQNTQHVYLFHLFNNCVLL